MAHEYKGRDPTSHLSNIRKGHAFKEGQGTRHLTNVMDFRNQIWIITFNQRFQSTSRGTNLQYQLCVLSKPA